MMVSDTESERGLLPRQQQEKEEEMISVKVTLGDGSSYTTSINGTFLEAQRYFLGKILNMGKGEKDLLKMVVAVELVKNV